MVCYSGMVRCGNLQIFALTLHKKTVTCYCIAITNIIFTWSTNLFVCELTGKKIGKITFRA